MVLLYRISNCFTIIKQKREVKKMQEVIKGVELTKDDTLKNILIMAPLLDEVGQNRVFGLMCGLLSGGTENEENKKAG